MKSFFYFPIRFSLLSIVLAVFLFSSCGLLEESKDDDDSGNGTTETVTTNFIIRTNFDSNFSENPEYLVKVRAYKVLYNGDTKEEQVFEKQHLGPNHSHDIATVEYNSNNTMTEVVIEAFAIDNNGKQSGIKKKIISHEVMFDYFYSNGGFEKYIARFNFSSSDFK